MPERTPDCHLQRPIAPETSPNVPPTGDTQCPETRLPVPPAHQWLHATTARIATDPYSWMQAVHWIHGSGHYTPQRAGGPRAMNHTTLLIAQEISALKECRPGVDYLARKLKISERTVKYHLGMLRETGLLVYRSKGTRIRGGGNQASVYERTIPVVFDTALGIRTIGEGVQRRPVGAAPEHRSLLGKLAKKAARKVRRPRHRTPLSGRTRCTPMEGGTSGSSSAAGTHSPPESKLASGQSKSPTPKSSKRGPRKLNKIGRRYQLARQLIETVPWLQSAAVPRIAWIVRHVADEGWTVLEVQAAAERFIADREPRRPSAVLAFRLASCHLLYTTPDRRKVLVEDWQDSRRAEQARHAEDAQRANHAQGPTDADVRDLYAEAVRRTREITNRQQATSRDDTDCFEIPVDAGVQDLDLMDLDPTWVQQVRKDAAEDLSSITDAIRNGVPERTARRLYTNWLVDQALAAERRQTLTPAF